VPLKPKSFSLTRTPPILKGLLEPNNSLSHSLLNVRGLAPS